MKTFLLTFGWIVGVANVLAVIFFAYVGWGPKWPRRRNFGIRPVYRHPALGAPYKPGEAITAIYADDNFREIVNQLRPDGGQIYIPQHRDRSLAPHGFFCPAECCDDPSTCKLAPACAAKATAAYKTN
jgi:hypothetical protein